MASASPRRQKLLADLGLHFQVKPSSSPEKPPATGETALDYALNTASRKGLEVAASCRNAVILAADTIVVLGKMILGKPENSQEAMDMLTALSGRTHQVISGCFIVDQSTGAQSSFALQTDVTMSRHDRDVLAAYIETGEPLDKAGSYAIQGSGAFMIESISGSYTNVVGLPLTETLAALSTVKAVRLAGH